VCPICSSPRSPAISRKSAARRLRSNAPHTLITHEHTSMVRSVCDSMSTKQKPRRSEPQMRCVGAVTAESLSAGRLFCCCRSADMLLCRTIGHCVVVFVWCSLPGQPGVLRNIKRLANDCRHSDNRLLVSNHTVYTSAAELVVFSCIIAIEKWTFSRGTTTHI